MAERNNAEDQDGSYDESEQQEYTTPLQVYRRLIIVVNNEEFSPDLLPYEESIVDCILDQIEHMKDSIKKLGNKLDLFCIEQHQMELERLTFIVNKYYRIRIQKIETNAQSLVNLLKSNQQLAFKILSPQEIKYLDNYISLIDKNLSSITTQMPANMQSFRLLDIQPDQQFNENHYVFVKALNDTSVLVDDPLFGQEVIQISKNSQHFLPFSAIKANLLSGSKDLLIL